MGSKLNKTSVFVNVVIGIFTFVVFAYINFTIYYLYQRNLQSEQVMTDQHSDRNLILTELVGQLVHEHYVDRDSVEMSEMLSKLWLKLHSTRLVQTSQAGSLFSLHDDKQQLVLRSEDSFSKVVLEVADWLYRDRKYADAFSWRDKRDSVLYVLNVILTNLDNHSLILRPSEYEELKQGTEGEFGGIGVSVSMKDDILTVLEPLPNSPAFFAGIKKDDQIIGIDDYGVYELTIDDLVEMMRGDPGTPVELSLLRADNMHPFNVDITRAIVQVESVASKSLYDTTKQPILYLQLKTFSSRSAQEINAALLKFRLRHNKHYGVILDLRGNPGGLLDQAIEVADQFISTGVLVRTTGHSVSAEQASFAPHENDYPMAVLIDADSASASEIVAGALQDHARAYVIGAPSFGKGSVQTVFELPFGQAIKLTVARYFTPDGRSIRGAGISPDIWLQPIVSTSSKAIGSHEFKDSSHVAAVKAYYLASNDDDPVLQTAIATLRNIIPTHARNKKFSTIAYRHKLPEIAEHVSSYDQTAIDWLADQHSLDWQPRNNQIYDARLQIAKIPKSVVGGDEFKLDYQVINTNTSTLRRASVYAQIRVDEMLTHEELIGHIAADAIHHGSLVFKIPTHANQQIYDVIVGLAIDGKVIDRQVRKVLVRSRPRTTLDLQVYSTDDVIAAGEVETVTIRITNHGEYAAKELKVKIQNLSGKQIQIPLSEHELSRLPAGKSISLQFPLHAARQLFTRTLSLGVQVASDDLQEPARKQYTIMSKPTAVQVGL